MKYVSIIGYYVDKETKEHVPDGGLWMLYESDDLFAVEADFLKVAEDLLPQYGDPKKIVFVLDVVQPLDEPMKMWKGRHIQKL